MIRVKEPTIVQSKWIWEIHRDGKFMMRGKASSEPEAWRLGKDAEKHFKLKDSK